MSRLSDLQTLLSAEQKRIDARYEHEKAETEAAFRFFSEKARRRGIFLTHDDMLIFRMPGDKKRWQVKWSIDDYGLATIDQTYIYHNLDDSGFGVYSHDSFVTDFLDIYWAIINKKGYYYNGYDDNGSFDRYDEYRTRLRKTARAIEIINRLKEKGTH